MSTVVRHYRELAAAHPELLDPGLAQALDDLCARFRDELDGAPEQLVIDEPALVRAELPVRLAALGDRLASRDRHADERDVRRLVLDLRRSIGGEFEIARAASRLAAPLTALGELDEALTLRREAFSRMLRRAGADRDRWHAAAAEAEALTDLLLRLDRPADVPQVADRLAGRLRRLGHRWAKPLRAVALRLHARARSATGEHEAAVAAAEEAVAAFRDLGDLGEAARTLDLLGDIHHAAGDHAAALAAATEALGVVRQDSGDAAAVAAAWGRLAVRHGRLGDWAAARDALREALAAGPPGGPLRARHLRLLAETYAGTGDAEAALRAMAESVEAYRELAATGRHLPDLALALVNLGARHAALGQGAEAVRATEEAVELYTRLAERDPGHQAGLAQAHGCLAERLDETGRPDLAVEHARRCADIYRRIGDADLPDALVQLGIHLHSAGDYAASAAAEAEALELYRAAGDLPGVALALFNAAITALADDRIDDAVPIAIDAVAAYQRLYEETEDWAPRLVNALRLLGDLRERTERVGHAITTLERAAGLLDRMYRPGDHETAENLAGVLHDLSRYHEAEERLDRSLELMRRSLALYGELTQHDPARFRGRLASAWLSLGIYLRKTGQDEECRAALAMSLDNYREIGDRPAVAHALCLLGEHLAEAGEFDRARPLLHESAGILEDLARDDTAHLGRLARVVDQLAATFEDQGEYAEALPHAERAADLWDEAGDIERLSEALQRLMFLLGSLGHDTEPALDRLGEILPDDGHLVQALNDVAQRFLHDDRLDEARRHLDRASAIWEIHTLRHPDADPFPHLHVLDSTATLLARLGRPDEAAATQLRVVEAFEERAADDPDTFLELLPIVLDRLADHLRDAERPLEALPYRRRCVELLERLAADDPGHRPALAAAVRDLGNLLRDLGHEEAAAVLDRADTLRAALHHED